jgi:hypothetical protein
MLKIEANSALANSPTLTKPVSPVLSLAWSKAVELQTPSAPQSSIAQQGALGENPDFMASAMLQGAVAQTQSGPRGLGPKRKPGEIVVTRYDGKQYLSKAEMASPAYKSTQRQLGEMINAETFSPSGQFTGRQASYGSVARAMTFIANAPISEPAKWSLYADYTAGLKTEGMPGSGINVSANDANAYVFDPAKSWNTAAHGPKAPHNDHMHFGTLFDGAKDFNVVLARIRNRELETGPQGALGFARTIGNDGYRIDGKFFNRGDANGSMQLAYAWLKANENADANGNPSFRTFSQTWQKGVVGAHKTAADLQNEYRVPWNNNTPAIADRY